MNFMGLPFVSSQVHDCCRVMAQYQIFAEVEVHWLVGCLSNRDYDRLDVLRLHIHRNEAIVVFAVDVDHDLLTVSAGSQACDFVEGDFPLDAVGEEGVG